jgi:hypothetical protein
MSNIEKQPNSAEKEKSLENIESSSEKLDELEKSLEREAEKAGEKEALTNLLAKNNVIQLLKRP